MFNLSLSRSLVTERPFDKDTLAPGLQEVLLVAVALRFGITVLITGMYLFLRTTRDLVVSSNADWLILLGFIEAGLLLAYVGIPQIRGRMGRYFLPAALSWLLIAPMIEHAITLLLVAQPFIAPPHRGSFSDIGFQTIWVLVPVILAAWQYGKTGWRIVMTILAIGYATLGIFIRMGGVPDLGQYVVMSIGWLGMIGFLGWVVMRLVGALRAEQRALLRANKQLAQRAATIEQLAESRERNRLARELHDTLAHSLTGVSVQLQALDTLMKHDPDAAEAQLKETQATVREGIHESRRAIDALRATPLEDLGLSEALRQLCQKQAERIGIEFHCEIDEVAALDPLTEQAIYRVAEAALANVERHAAASTVTVRLRKETIGTHLQLEVQDDGVGFDVSNVPEDRFGIAGMRERAELVGGDLRIESAPGRGTKAILSIED